MEKQKTVKSKAKKLKGALFGAGFIVLGYLIGNENARNKTKDAAKSAASWVKGKMASTKKEESKETTTTVENRQPQQPQHHHYGFNSSSIRK